MKYTKDLSLVKEADKVYIHRSSDIAEYIRPKFSELTIRESAYVVYLNNANRIVAHYELSKGGVTGTVVDPKLILAGALQAKTVNVVLVHNHPSGSLKPSSQDIKLTQKLKNGCAFMDMRLLDHIILTEESYYSFLDEGTL